MDRTRHSLLAGFAITVLAAVSLASCASGAYDISGDAESMTRNPVSYVEIPVADMDRAVRFYEAVFRVSLERTVVDGHEMALFPFDEDARGVTGALASGDSYVPSTSGPRVYFSVDSIEETLELAVSRGGSVAYPKTRVGDFWVAEFEDSEGNRIALSSAVE